MIILKVWYRICGLLLKALYKVIYGGKFTWGKGFHVRKRFHATVEGANASIRLGDNVAFNDGCSLHALDSIEIGSETIFGENVKIYDHNHRFADPDVPIKDQGYSTAPVVIGRHCWIGSNVTILKGSHIGDNTVIGAGCVINGDVPADCVVSVEQKHVIQPIRRPNKAGGVNNRKNGQTKELQLNDSASENNRGDGAPMRVLVLDTVMDRGGAETMMMNYLRHFNRDEVVYDFLVNRDYRAAYEDEIERLGGQVYRMCPMYPQYFGKYKKQIREFLKAHPEYRIIHSNLEERSYFGLKEAKKLGIPVRIAHAHNRPVGFDLKSIFREYFRLRLPAQVTHMFACGEEAGDWLFGKKNRGKVIQQRNAIDTSLYRYDADTARQVREEFGVTDSNTIVLGHVGRFFPQKNHTFLIDIFKAVHDQHPNSVLWLVGGGELHDELKNQIRAKVDEFGLHDAVRFLGVRSDVNRIMQGMDAFVLPSLFEGLPVTMIEAQASGLPCTISDRVPPQCDIIGNTQIVPLEAKPEEWARHILSQVAHPKVADRAEGPALVTKAGFDIVKNAEWLQRFYKEALAKAEREHA